MGLAWFGNTDWCDDRAPEVAVPVKCGKCGEHDTWLRPMTYNGSPPKHPCGGTVSTHPSDDKQGEMG